MYQFSSICRTQTLCQPRPSGLVNTMNFPHFYFPVSGHAVVTGVVPSPPRFLPSTLIAHRVQQSHCSSICHRVLLTHALALSASQIVLKKKSQRFHTSMHSAVLELTKLTYTRLEDDLIRHRGALFPCDYFAILLFCRMQTVRGIHDTKRPYTATLTLSHVRGEKGSERAGCPA